MGLMDGQVVCITGASRGLGASFARAFAAEGAHLVLGARNQAALDDVAAELPSALAAQCDVSRVQDVRDLVGIAIGEFGRLDVMINNAGVASFGPVLSVLEHEFDEMVATNLKGTFFGSQIALAAMRSAHRGLIVNVSSIAGRPHRPNEAAYSATKWAVRGLTGALRIEAEQYNVRVTTLRCGGMATPMWKEMEFLPFPPEVDPDRDFLQPDEVAKMIVGLACRSPRFVVPEVVCAPMLPRHIET
jgi:NAD(P)-dependent dehydrogenase (short-subunit alcohol dehydrogenase family)